MSRRSPPPSPRAPRRIFVNTPSNPTGWTADRETLQAILDLARKHDLWIIADEIYALFHYGGRRAASFLDIMEPEDRILFVNTFSKNWAMTGWRIGWLRTHPSLGRMFENLIQYSTSGVAQFMQRGAIAALDEGDGFIAEQVERARKARDIVCRVLGETGKVALQRAAGRLLPVLLGRRHEGCRTRRLRHRRQGGMSAWRPARLSATAAKASSGCASTAASTRSRRPRTGWRSGSTSADESGGEGLPLQRRASFWTRKGRCSILNLCMILSENRFRFSGSCTRCVLRGSPAKVSTRHSMQMRARTSG